MRNFYTRVDDLVDSRTRTIKDQVTDLGLRFIKSFGTRLKNRYGYTIDVQDSYALHKLNDWLKTVDHKFNIRPMTDNKLLADTSFILNLDTNTFIYVIAGTPIIDSKTRNTMLYLSDRGDRDREITPSNHIKLFIYGKFAKKYLELIKNNVLSTRRPDNELVIYNISTSNNNYDKREDKESFQSIITTLNPRKINTLFYDDGIEEEIISHIDSFFANKSLYEKRNINFKTSILLYGEPGTGKSSLANALCNLYNLNMVLVDMNTFDKLDVSILTSCINGDDKTYIVVLEDIDTVFALDREGEDKTDKDDKKVINKLLQFMDSNNSPSNVIFIATTNHVEKLDKALTRKGRIDKQIYVGPINKETARKMCDSFNLTDDQIHHIMGKHLNEEKINQSSLQGDILEEMRLSISDTKQEE